MPNRQNSEIANREETKDNNSFQVYQDVYNKLTGRTETSNNLFFENHIIKIEDLKNLHHTIEQCLEQYNCVSSTCTVSTSYSNGKTERFSGFEKFERLACNRSSCTTEVALQYDFLIILPKTSDPQPYKLELRVRSIVGLLQRLKSMNASKNEIEFVKDFATATGIARVSYVDLAVARALEAQTDDWYRSLPKNPANLFAKAARRFPYEIAMLTRIIALAAGGISVYEILGNEIQTNQDLYKAGMIAATILMSITMLGLYASNKITSWLKNIGPHSLICLSKADSLAESDIKKEARTAWIKTALTQIVNICVGLFVAYAAKRLGF